MTGSHFDFCSFLILLGFSVFFLGVRAAFGEKYGVKWDSFIHASITGIGASVAIYLSLYASSVLTGYEGKKIWKDFSSFYK